MHADAINLPWLVMVFFTFMDLYRTYWIRNQRSIWMVMTWGVVTNFPLTAKQFESHHHLPRWIWKTTPADQGNWATSKNDCAAQRPAEEWDGFIGYDHQI